MQQTFKVALRAIGPNGAWTCIAAPFSVHEVFGTRGRVPVAGTLNGHAFRNSLMTEGNGRHRMMISKELGSAANVRPGDTVEITLARDTAERVSEVPEELERALAGDQAASAIFEALAPSHRKEYAEWISGAKKPENKAARAAKALELLRAGRKRLR